MARKYKKTKDLIDQDYLESLNKVQSFADGAGIDIHFVNEPDHNYYCVGQKRVIVSSCSSPWEALAYLLHEIGHCLDESINPKQFNQPAFSENFLTTTDEQVRKLFIEREERAWFYAESLARLLKIDIESEWYWRAKINSLDSYRNHKPKNKKIRSKKSVRKV